MFFSEETNNEWVLWSKPSDKTGISMNVYSSTPVDGVNALLKASVTAVLQWSAAASMVQLFPLNIMLGPVMDPEENSFKITK